MAASALGQLRKALERERHEKERALALNNRYAATLSRLRDACARERFKVSELEAAIEVEREKRERSEQVASEAEEKSRSLADELSETATKLDEVRQRRTALQESIKAKLAAMENKVQDRVKALNLQVEHLQRERDDAKGELAALKASVTVIDSTHGT